MFIIYRLKGLTSPQYTNSGEEIKGGLPDNSFEEGNADEREIFADTTELGAFCKN